MSFLKKMLFGEPKAEGGGAGGGSGKRASSVSPPPGAKQDAVQSMAAIQEQIETITKKMEHNNLKIAQEETKIKEILKECGGDPKKRERRMPEIKRHMEAKARLETLNKQESGKSANLQEMVYTMQAAISDQEYLSSMANGAKAMKQVAAKQEDVEDTVEEVRNLMDEVSASSRLISEQMNPDSAVDEDEMLAALDELEEEALDEVSFLTRDSSIIIRHNSHRWRRKMRNFRIYHTPWFNSLMPAKNRFPRSRLHGPKRIKWSKTSSTGAPLPLYIFLSAFVMRPFTGLRPK